MGTATVRPGHLLTEVNHRQFLGLHSIALLPKVFDFLHRKSLKKGLSIMSTCRSVFPMCSLKMQIKTASVEGAHPVSWPDRVLSLFTLSSSHWNKLLGCVVTRWHTCQPSVKSHSPHVPHNLFQMEGKSGSIGLLSRPCSSGPEVHWLRRRRGGPAEHGSPLKPACFGGLFYTFR